ncbi:MAG: alpha/beta hydrolase [Syntrophobacterales bacterium]|jgi:pimeloyl-[acyl-carrier protein] methyl ester esterase|nr:alpha/beta hydrolase [Syntrophobacterales bacterium]
MNNLVLFHGWGATGRVWARQAEYFQDRLTVRAPTIPAWESDWFTEYLRGLPLQECLLVGWSLGGMLLLAALSELAPLRPAGLVLAGVAPVFTRRPDHPWGQPPAVVRAMRRGLKANQRQVLADFADQCLVVEETAFVAQAREAFAFPAPAAALAAGLDYLLQADLRPLLPGLPPGAVIIQGQADRIMDPAQGRYLAEQLPGARLHLLPGAGHLPFLTQAAAFNRILQACLAGEE